MKKVQEFLFLKDAMTWIAQQETDNYIVDKNIFSRKYEVFYTG